MTDAATATETMIEPKVLLGLVQEANNITSDINEQRGELGERIKHHKEFSNLNNQVFRISCRLDRMDEIKRKEFIRHLNHQLGILGREKWGLGAHVGDLVDMAQKAPDAPAEDEFDAAAPKKSDGLSPEQATAAFEATKDKAGSGPDNGRKKTQDSIDQFRETLKKDKANGSAVVPMNAAKPSERATGKGSYKVTGA